MDYIHSTSNTAFLSLVNAIPGFRDLGPEKSIHLTYSVIIGCAVTLFRWILIKATDNTARKLLGILPSDLCLSLVLAEYPHDDVQALDRLIEDLDTIKRENNPTKKFQILQTQTRLPKTAVRTAIRAKRKQSSADKNVRRWHEAFFQGIMYTFTFVMGCFVLFDKSWYWSVMDFWSDEPIETDVRFYLLFQLGWYLHLLYWTTFLETRRSDTNMMIFHHLVTIGLVFTAYLCVTWRVGAAILLIHDAADPFLQWAKLFKYMNFGRTVDALFAVLIFVWFFTRLTIYPMYVWGAWMDAPRILPHKAKIYRIGSVFCGILVFMHIYWFSLILKVAVRALLHGGDLDDVRSEED